MLYTVKSRSDESNFKNINIIFVSIYFFSLSIQRLNRKKYLVSNINKNEYPLKKPFPNL